MIPNETSIFEGENWFEMGHKFFVPEEPLDDEDQIDQDEFLADLLFMMLTPISPYFQARHAGATMLATIIYPSEVADRHKMLDEWWFENEPDLSAEFRGLYAKKRLGL